MKKITIIFILAFSFGFLLAFVGSCVIADMGNSLYNTSNEKHKRKEFIDFLGDKRMFFIDGEIVLED